LLIQSLEDFFKENSGTFKAILKDVFDCKTYYEATMEVFLCNNYKLKLETQF